MKYALAKSVLVVALVSNPLFAQTRGRDAAQFPAPLSLMNFSPSFSLHPAGVTLLSRVDSGPAKRQFWFQQSSNPAGTLSLSPNAGSRGADSLWFDAKLKASAMQIQPAINSTGTLKFVPAVAAPKSK